MSLESLSLKETCERFNSFRWHDSKMVSFELLPNPDEQTYDFCLYIKLLTNNQSEGILNERKLIFRECRIVQLDLDLLGMQLIGGDIADAFCDTDADLNERKERDQLSHFDLPQDELSLAEFLYFRILFIHPGGEIKIFARSFELL